MIENKRASTGQNHDEGHLFGKSHNPSDPLNGGCTGQGGVTVYTTLAEGEFGEVPVDPMSLDVSGRGCAHFLAADIIVVAVQRDKRLPERVSGRAS